MSVNSVDPNFRPKESPENNLEYIVVIGWFWKRRFLIIGSSIFIGVLAVVLTYFTPPIFTAKVTILPQKQIGPSGLLGQVATFSGMSLDMDSSWEQFYGKIAMSDVVLEKAIKQQWSHMAFPDSVSLFEIFSIKMEDDGGEYSARAIGKLKHILRSRVLSFYRDSFTGFMMLGASFPYDGETAADFANFIVREINNFNHQFNSEKSGEKRIFLEERVEIVGSDLHDAALAQSEFINNNRSYQTSPYLSLQFQELSREVQAQTTLWIELRRQLEVARIGELSETQLVSVLEWATPPQIRSKPKRRLSGIIGLFIGGLLSIFGLFILEQLRNIYKKLKLL